jgi:hypothetical protein
MRQSNPDTHILQALGVGSKDYDDTFFLHGGG